MMLLALAALLDGLLEAKMGIRAGGGAVDLGEDIDSGQQLCSALTWSCAPQAAMRGSAKLPDPSQSQLMGVSSTRLAQRRAVSTPAR